MMKDEMCVFTVADTENGSKPIVYAKALPASFGKSAAKIIEIIGTWIDGGMDFADMTDAELDEIALNVRDKGYGWYAERYCFEITALEK